MPRILENDAGPAFAFNITAELNKAVAGIATLVAAASHGFGWGAVGPALDVVIVCILFGVVQASIWLVLDRFFGIRIMRGFPSLK